MKTLIILIKHLISNLNIRLDFLFGRVPFCYRKIGQAIRSRFFAWQKELRYYPSRRIFLIILNNIIYKKYIIVCLSIFFIVSCGKEKIQNPSFSNNHNKNHLDTLIDFNKQKENVEQKYLKDYISSQKDTFEQTSNGFWIKFIVKNNNQKAQKLDYVKYSAEISDIQGKIIYTFQEFGIKDGILTKFHEIRAIEKSLALMAKNEEIIILSTSFNAFSTFGDEKKIPANFPIKIKLKLLDVKKL